MKRFFVLLPGTTSSMAEYARVWILCPVWLFVAYVLSVELSNNCNTVLRYLFVVITALVLVLFGSNLQNNNMINEANNRYKVRADSVALADELIELSAGRPISAWIFLPKPVIEDKFVDGGTLYEGIMQYSAEIELYRYFYTDEIWDTYFVSDYMPDGVTPSEECIPPILDQLPHDYVIWPDESRLIPKMENCGYELLSRVDGYLIFAPLNEE
ncbi:MAG: hypothetical protein K6F79_00175 [Saccharofermentans sp.]|nr:hypothetical protein [Saccharofermentans sp.]